MAELPPIKDYEDVSVYGLDAAAEGDLLSVQNECVFMWANKAGWPVGVIMSYVFRDGRFWITGSRQRARFSAIARDPRVSICVTSKGTTLGPNKTVTYKCNAIMHDDQGTKDWFYPALSAVLRPDSEKGQRQFAAFLDSPRRVIVECVPVHGGRIGYDGAKMGRATQAALKAERSLT